MLFANNLAQNGNELQKHKYLPDACNGTKICGMGMSEPDAGTDVLGMLTTATKSADGSYYTLNGTKMWITNGTVDGKTTGDLFLVYALTNGGEGASQTVSKTRGGSKNITSFIIEKGMPGFDLGQKITDKW